MLISLTPDGAHHGDRSRVAVYDFDLVKRSLTITGIATLISLVVSACIFSLTPLQQAQ